MVEATSARIAENDFESTPEVNALTSFEATFTFQFPPMMNFFDGAEFLRPERFGGSLFLAFATVKYRPVATATETLPTSRAALLSICLKGDYLFLP